MKKQILISLILFSSIMTVNAQWNGSTTIEDYLWRNGNVGIGATNPVEKLTLGSNLVGQNMTGADRVYNSITFFNSNTYRVGEIKSIQVNSNYGDVGHLAFYTCHGTSTEKMRITDLGYIGLGTSSPIERLTLGSNLVGQNTTGGDRVYNAITFYNSNEYRVGEIKSIQTNSTYGDVGHLAFYTCHGTSTEKMRITDLGYIGIGTTSPAYKLDVAGTIRACEVKVDLLNGCDFVFKSNYKLMDLKELEKFVKTNQHLPEIASEKEMVENGVNMKELQMKLLQKMEEMTLYIIEQNRKIEILENELKELKTK